MCIVYLYAVHHGCDKLQPVFRVPSLCGWHPDGAGTATVENLSELDVRKMGPFESSYCM